MDKDLIIDVGQSDISIALLENKRLIELNQEKTEGRGYSVGDVYLGRVKKILPSLNAAFVDIGDEKDAFVHYLDLGLNFKAFDHFVRNINSNSDFTQLYRSTRIDDILEKEGKIERFLSPGQPIAVQIVKEPISTKGSRLTAEISIAGRNLVLLPFADKVSISQKISSREEKKRLEQLLHEQQRLKNRLSYLEKGERQKRAHRLITKGAAIEKLMPGSKEMGEAEFFSLMEQILSLPSVLPLLPKESDEA